MALIRNSSGAVRSDPNTTVQSPADFALAAGLFALSVFWRWPPWAIALVGACAGAVVRGG